jgi:hypothetical protein
LRLAHRLTIRLLPPLPEKRIGYDRGLTETRTVRSGLLRRLLRYRLITAEQALVFASMRGQTDVVRLLLDRGVNANASPPGSHWTATPLHTAAIQDKRLSSICSCGAALTPR